MNDNAKKWVDALRSGEYTQGKGNLANGGTFCCLGVACDLYTKENPDGQWDANTTYAYNRPSVFSTPSTVTDGIESSTSSLTERVRLWLGLDDKTGGFNYPIKDQISLIGLNDKGVSFKEIADVIESKPKGLFE